MKKFLIKLGLFLLPFVVAVSIELFVLPIDLFTFRVWEALRVEGTSITPGKFYPQSKLQKEEVGRDTHHTQYAVKKEALWIIDKYGYRKEEPQPKISVVIVGDSFIAGDGLDQKEIVSEQLEDKLGLGVYPVASGNINDFLNMPRFCKKPPTIVVFQKLEDTVENLKKPKLKPFKQKSWEIRQKLSENSIIRFIDITQNRLIKANMLNYYKSRIRDWMGLRKFDCTRIKEVAGQFIISTLPDRTNEEEKKGYITKIVSRLVDYQNLLNKQGIRFIFMPVPNKSTIYYKIAGMPHSPTFMDDLVAAATDAGIETINLKDAYFQILEQNGKLLYIPDGTHWNDQGAKIAAELLADQIQNKTTTKSNERLARQAEI